jgi:hypothetical protein
MKIIFCLLLATVLAIQARELSFKSSGIKSRPLDPKFLKQVLDYQGEYNREIVEATLELGVSRVFIDASVRHTFSF